jgi:hypothetical protein
MSENRRAGQVDEEDDFHPIINRTWYIKRTYDGHIIGKIQFQPVSLLEIVPANIPEPEEATQEQIANKVAPRKITIQATKQTALSGKQEKPPLTKFSHQVTIQGVDCSVFMFT